MKNESVLISIIVPVYNVEPYLERCVHSIIAQTHKNIEIIIVDDGSPDNCPQICDCLKMEDNRIKVIHKTNGGLSSARNAGLDIANGDYIGFVDSDDYIESTMYEDMLKSIIDKRGVIALTGVINEDEDGNYISDKCYNDSDQNFIERDCFYKSLLMYKGDCSAWSKLFPRDVIGNVRFKNDRLNEDVLFIFEIMNELKGVVCTESLGYHYVIRKGSICRSFGKSQHDMICNAHEINLMIKEKLPQLIEYGDRFEIYQNMMFLNAFPYNLNSHKDPMFKHARCFLLKSVFVALKNNNLTVLDKIRFFVLLIVPRLFSYAKSIKNGRNK